MAKIFIGNKGYKLNLGNTKIKRGYIGDKIFYTGAVKVYYHIDENVVYVESIEQGQSCLDPQSFNPRGLKSGYTFHGWREDTTASETVLENKIAGEVDIHLYAVYKKEITVSWYNGSTNPTTTIYFVYYNNGNNLYPQCTSEESTLIPVTGYTNSLGWTNTIGSYEQIYNSGAIITFKSDISLYSIYSTTITVNYVNGGNTGVKTISGLISRSYSGTIYNTYLTATLTHTEISNYTSDGWTDQLNSISKKYDDGEMSFGPSWNGKTLYAIYKRTFNVYRVEANSSTTSTKKTISVARYIEYIAKNTTYKVQPTLELKEKTISGWDTYAWSASSAATDIVDYNDNITLELVEGLEGKTFYPLYKKTVSIYVINGATTPSRSTKSANRLRKFYGTSSTQYVTIDPSIKLSLNKLSGYTKYGWNNGGAADTRAYFDGDDVLIDQNAEGKTFYGLYIKAVTVSWYNNSTTPYKETKDRYDKAIVNGWQYKDPTFSRGVDPFSGWNVLGWSTSSSYQTTATYASGADITVHSNLSLFAIYRKKVTLTTIATGVSSSTSKYAYYNRGLGSSPSQSNPTFTVAKPTASDRTFVGWTKDKNIIRADYSNINNTVFSDSTTLYALFQWNDAVLYDNPAGREFSVPYGFYTENHHWDLIEIDTNKYSSVSVKLSASILVYQAQMGGSAYATIHGGTYPPTAGHSTDQYHIDLRGQSYYQSDPQEIAGLPCSNGATAIVVFDNTNMKKDANNKCKLILGLEDYHREGKFLVYLIFAYGTTVAG